MASKFHLSLPICALIFLLSLHGARSQRPPSLPSVDKTALYAFSTAADTPDKYLAKNWIGDPCLNAWYGVTCTQKKFVQKLELIGLNISGTISPQLSKLSRLEKLDLSDNFLSGPIPPELGQLPKLLSLHLSNNSLTGPIPIELANIPTLQEIYLGLNHLNGTIPDALFSLPNLMYVALPDNELTGPVPTLAGVNLTSSQFAELTLSRNSLTGPIPDFPPLPTLNSIDLGRNQLTGPIPTSLANLPNLFNLYLGGNRLTGSIPMELINTKVIMNLYVGQNNLTGPLPPVVGEASPLFSLDLSQNAFTGPIPPSFGNLSALQALWLYENQLDGEIPSELGSLSGLQYLYLERNNLTGPIPPALGSLINLGFLYLHNNNLTGSIPLEFNNLVNLTILSIASNSLVGPIPPKLGMSEDAELFDFSDNYLNGTVPPQLWNASVALNCLGLNSSSYYMTGQRDSQICSQFYPDLTCRCPPPLVLGTNGSCYCVQPLRSQVVFTCNSFHSVGNFSQNLGGVMQQLADVPMPMLSADQVAPVNFTTSRTPCSVLFTFHVLPLNGTTLGSSVAAIQDGLSAQRSNVSVPYFNPGYLYIGSQELRASTGDTPPLAATGKDSKVKSWIIAVVSSGSALLLVAVTAFIALLVFKRRNRPIRMVIPGTSVKSWRFTQLQSATKNFSDDAIIGSGGFGMVFKGELDGSPVAVKRLAKGSNQGHAELAKEVEVIGSIHHRNLVCLEGYCIEGEEYLLVYNLMVNGSLEDWLFNKPEKGRLSWSQCANIIRGTANALAYLHVGCKEKIIHRDIKPANILLDDQFEAHVADFGLARTTMSVETHVSTRVMGTMGYLAPEYAHTGQLTEKSDVYSFGMVILVILSHREAVDLKQQEGNVSLVSHVCDCVKQDRLLDLIAPHFVDDYDEKEALRLIHVAILCIQQAWQARPTMDEVRQILTKGTEVPDDELASAVSMLRQDIPLDQFWISGINSMLASSVDSSLAGKSNISTETT